MKTPLVSFFADVDGKTYYSDHAKRFIKNCRNLNIPFIVRELETKGNYRDNCLAKPRFIMQMMQEINSPFVWMDIDSIIHKPLNVFDDLVASCDIALAFTKIPTKEDNSISLPKASPLFVNNTNKGIEFIYKWVKARDEIIQKKIPVFDHEVLVQVFLKEIKNIRIGCLPVNYCIWPGEEEKVQGEKYITMGLADVDSKQENLKHFGFDEKEIQRQSVGNKFVEVI